MDKTKLKKGSVIKWTADRMFKRWDTYGVVKSIRKGQVKIFTYDDFKETTISLDGEAVRDEITLSTQDMVDSYLNKLKRDLNRRLVDLKTDYEDDVRGITKQLEKIETYIK